MTKKEQILMCYLGILFILHYVIILHQINTVLSLNLMKGIYQN